MPEVTNELMYKLSKKIHQRTERLERGLGEVKHKVVAMRLQGLATRVDQRLERIEQRLDLRELAESQTPFDPKS